MDLIDASGNAAPPQTTSYTPPTFAITPAGSQVVALPYDIATGDLINVTVYQARRSSIRPPRSSTWTSAAIPWTSRRPTSGPVTVKVTIATPAFHANGDLQFYTGLENLQVGQPVVDSNNNLVYDSKGVVLYTAATILDSRNNVKKHSRGEPVFINVNGTWKNATYTSTDPAFYLGNEPIVYLGGEPAYFSVPPTLEQAVINPH